MPVKRHSAKPALPARVCFATFRERLHSSSSRIARIQSVLRILMPSMLFVATLLIYFFHEITYSPTRSARTSRLHCRLCERKGYNHRPHKTLATVLHSRDWRLLGNYHHGRSHGRLRRFSIRKRRNFSYQKNTRTHSDTRHLSRQSAFGARFRSERIFQPKRETGRLL